MTGCTRLRVLMGEPESHDVAGSTVPEELLAIGRRRNRWMKWRLLGPGTKDVVEAPPHYVVDCRNP